MIRRSGDTPLFDHIPPRLTLFEHTRERGTVEVEYASDPWADVWTVLANPMRMGYAPSVLLQATPDGQHQTYTFDREPGCRRPQARWPHILHTVDTKCAVAFPTTADLMDWASIVNEEATQAHG